MTFVMWLHGLSWWQVSAYQFNWMGSRIMTRKTYGQYLFGRYLKWCERKGVEPEGEASDYKGI